MEIVTELVQTGKELREGILATFGSLEKLKEAAASGDVDAKENLAILAILEKDPARLASDWKTTTVSRISPKDISAISEKRLALLDFVQGPKRVAVTELAAKMKRDKKNVSQDLKVLARMGFVRMERRGRQAYPRPVANEVRIHLGRGSPEDLGQVKKNRPASRKTPARTRRAKIP